MATSKYQSEVSIMAEIIETVLKNTQRIHGRNGLDWIKIGSIRAARILLKSKETDTIPAKDIQ